VCRTGHGFVGSPVGKSPATSGHVTQTDTLYQAVPIRCPQQSSSQYISDSGHAPAATDVELPPLPGDQHVFSYPSQGFVPPQLQHRYHSRHHHNHAQKLQSSPQHALRDNSNGHNVEMRPLTGDYGDHKEVKLLSGSAGNINLYRPDSPAYVSSSTLVTANHWSPSRGIPASSQPYPSIPPLTSVPSSQPYPSMPSLTSVPSSPGQETASRPVYCVKSPVKKQKHRSRTNQHQSRRGGEPKESLSPPVKQRAERELSESASDSSSGCIDVTRQLTGYSQLSDRMQEHQNRQGELQHYVRMLLQKAPGSVCSEPERDQHLSDPEILESSRDLTGLFLDIVTILLTIVTTTLTSPLGTDLPGFFLA
jgi:hypothetical protein